MSSVIVDWSSEKTVVIATCNKDFQLSQEITLLIASIIDLVETQSAEVDLIVDMRNASIGLDDVIMAANHGRKSERSVFRHPQIKRVVYVSTSRLVELGAKGLNNPVFGNLTVRVAGSVEDGLALLVGENQDQSS
jgi:hypothetical protein